jgi:hypothetical protein
MQLCSIHDICFHGGRLIETDAILCRGSVLFLCNLNEFLFVTEMLICSCRRLDLLDVFLQAACAKTNTSINTLHEIHPFNYFCILKPSFYVKKVSVFNEDVVNKCDVHNRTEECSI